MLPRLNRTTGVFTASPDNGETGFRVFIKIFRLAKMSGVPFFFSALLAAISTAFEILTIAFLTPFVRCILEGSFAAMQQSRFMIALHEHGVVDFSRQRYIFVAFVVLIFASSTLKNLFQYMALNSCSYNVRKLTDQLRQRVFSRIMSLGKIYFDRQSAGALHEKLISFTSLLGQQLTDLRFLFVNILMLIAYAGVMIFISWKLAMFTTVIFPASYFLLRWILEKIKRTSFGYARIREELGRKIFNIFSCIELVKLYSQERQEAERFRELSGQFRNFEYGIDKKINFAMPVQEVLMLFFTMILVFIMALMWKHGEGKSPAEYLVYFYILRRAAACFSVLNNIRANASSLSGPVKEIENILNAGDDAVVSDGTRQFSGSFAHIRFDHVKFSYSPDVPILKDVTLVIEKGTMIALVGPTGAGKTTIINLLTRLYDPPSGGVLVDGIDIREFQLASWRAKFAIVSQAPQLFNDSLRNNLTYGLDRPVAEDEIADVLKKARLESFVHSLPEGIETVIGDRGAQLSGGERQRLSIARAMLKKAEILILDEATSALDSKTEREIQEAIEELVKGKTIIVIAHRLSTILHASKVVFVDGGSIVEQGRPRELIDAKGRFFELCKAQNITEPD